MLFPGTKAKAAARQVVGRAGLPSRFGIYSGSKPVSTTQSPDRFSSESRVAATRKENREFRCARLSV